MASETETMCYCSRVTKADVLRAKKEGARTLAEIRYTLGACTRGRCKQAQGGADARARSTFSWVRGTVKPESFLMEVIRCG